MKSIITLVALVIMASPSFAATTKKAPAKKTTTSAVKTEDTTTASTYTSHQTSKSGINWQAGLGLGTAGSLFHFGPLVNGMVSVANTEAGEILVGGQTGFLYGPGSGTTWIIPIMASSQMNFKSSGKITPYAGLAMGVGIFHSGAASSVASTLASLGFTTASVSATSTDFALLAKGGIYFGEESKYYAELPLGTLGNSFTIFPSVGMKF